MMGEIFSQICIALCKPMSQLLVRSVFDVPSCGLFLPRICLKVSILRDGPLGREDFPRPQY